MYFESLILQLWTILGVIISLSPWSFSLDQFSNIELRVLSLEILTSLNLVHRLSCEVFGKFKPSYKLKGQAVIHWVPWWKLLESVDLGANTSAGPVIEIVIWLHFERSTSNPKSVTIKFLAQHVTMPCLATLQGLCSIKDARSFEPLGIQFSVWRLRRALQRARYCATLTAILCREVSS